MRVSFLTSLLASCLLILCDSQIGSAQRAERGVITLEPDSDATWGPSTSSRLLAARLGIRIGRGARLTLDSVPVELLIQNVDSEAESVTGANAELMFAVRLTPLYGTSAERKSVPFKAEFLRNAPRSLMGYRGGSDLPPNAVVRYKVDLARWFDFKHPGSYDVRICYSPTLDISEGYDIDKRCQLGPEVTTVLHIIPADSNDRKEATKEKAKQ